jgi:hypothetical protein
MRIPNYFTSKFVDENGYLTPEYQNFFQQLISQLQSNLSDEGYKLPQQPTSVITVLNTAASKAAILYDSTTDEAKINIAGTFKVIQVV